MLNQELTDLCIALEHFQTPQWSIDSILKKEIFTKFVVDPCAGDGRMAESLKANGYNASSIDIKNWGYENLTLEKDFLSLKSGDIEGEFSVFMNPPFSKTVEFVEQCFNLGARKIVMFQRYAFKESSGRRKFFEKYPLARTYICCDRASSFRFDIPKNDKGQYINEKTGKVMGGTPTMHGFFVWEQGQEQTNPPSFSLYK